MQPIFNNPYVVQCSPRFDEQNISRIMKSEVETVSPVESLLCTFFTLETGDLFTLTLKPLFVFSLSDPKQNARSLLTPVSGTVLYVLSHGTLGSALHGSFFNHF